jgi:hypothetical protein
MSAVDEPGRCRSLTSINRNQTSSSKEMVAAEIVGA